MSYYRFTDDSDVYAVLSTWGYEIFIGNNKSIQRKTLRGFENQLKKLRARGYKIPKRVFERIAKEKLKETK